MTDTTAPTVRLAGIDWAIPVLSIKQNRAVIPAFFRFMPAFLRISALLATKDADPLWYVKISLTTEDFDNICDAIYGSLVKAKPGLGRNEFDGLTIDLEEMFAALPVIAQQTGILKPVAVSAGDPAPGEATAAVEPQTSISSSPITAPVPASDGPTPLSAS